MTYAEAMNRAEVWFRYWDSPLVDRKKQDAEALAVLRQALPLMEAAERIDKDAWAASGRLDIHMDAIQALADFDLDKADAAEDRLRACSVQLRAILAAIPAGKE